jgi:hypothetical protein
MLPDVAAFRPLRTKKDAFLERALRSHYKHLRLQQCTALPSRLSTRGKPYGLFLPIFLSANIYQVPEDQVWYEELAL